MNRSLHAARAYTAYLLAELRSPINYLIAGVVGATILLLQGYSPLGSWIPYIVPVLVQSFSKAGLRYSNRGNEILLKLPQEREDPALVVSDTGEILAATGRTAELLEEHGVDRLEGLILEASCPDYADVLLRDGERGEVVCFSDLTRRWYRIRSRQERSGEGYLVWFEDMSAQVRLEERLGELQAFTADIVDRASEGVTRGWVTAELARRVLKSGYTSIFVTREEEDGELSGRVYRFVQGALQESDIIHIKKDSAAPILLSSRRSRVVSGEKGPTMLQSRFEIDHPFDPRVKEFTGEPIESYVNYSSGGVAVIAFNAAEGISEQEEHYIEAVVNVVRIAYRIAKE